MKMQKVLMEAFDGRSSNFTPYFPESSILARVHYEIYRDSTRLIKYDLKEIEQKLIDVWRSWKYDLRESLLKRFGEERGNCLWNKYQKAFPAGYQETFSSGSAAIDIDYIERLKDAWKTSLTALISSSSPCAQVILKLLIQITCPSSSTMR